MSAKTWSRRQPWLLGPLVALAAGCAAHHSQLEQALLADRNPAAHSQGASAEYRVHCPDVLEVRVAGSGGPSRRCRIGADGRIDLGDAGRLRVDSQTTPQVAAAAAELLDVSAGRVEVRVAEFSSQQVYVFGEVTGQQRALPYRGPETVLDLLQRAGGLTPGAAPSDVEVVRPHVADGKTPEVFHVSLDAILHQNDQHSNVRLEPFDQVYIGQSSPSRLRPCVPPWLRPLYEALCGMRRDGTDVANGPGLMPSDLRPASPVGAGR
jgi:protein involved in polysaccharide export with SLBB domain